MSEAEATTTNHLLKGDRWGGNGLAWRKYERYLNTEGRKNRKAAEQEEQAESDGVERDSL